MPKRRYENRNGASRPARAKPLAAVAVILCVALAAQGCFDPVYPQLDRDARVMEAVVNRDSSALPPSPLSAADAVVYALANNLDAKVAEIEIAYQNESAVATRRRMLPSLTARYSTDHSNHPSARWSESTKSGNQSLESSYSSNPNSRQGEIGVMWNLLDFGVGYLRSRQQGERIRYSQLQKQRVRQQVVLDVLSNYWRAAAADLIAKEAQTLRQELETQVASIRDSVEMRILSGAEGARRELAIQGGLSELEQYRRYAIQMKLELARVMGCGNASEFRLARFPLEPPQLPPLPNNDASALQVAALKRRPELYQHDAQERIAVDEARLAVLQMAPTANLSLNLYDDPDKFLEWNNWMTVGARVSWNLFSIPARLSERRQAKLQGEVAKQKGLALAAAIMAQVGIAFSDWRLSHEYCSALNRRAEARQRLVEALAAGEKDGQTRPGEVLQERVRLLAEKAATLRAAAEVRVAGARLANAIGLDVDDCGRLVWQLDDEVVHSDSDNGVVYVEDSIFYAEREAQNVFPNEISGLEVVKDEDFMVPDQYFETGHVVSARDEAGGYETEYADSANVSPWGHDRRQENRYHNDDATNGVVPYRARSVDHSYEDEYYPDEYESMAPPAYDDEEYQDEGYPEEVSVMTAPAEAGRGGYPEELSAMAAPAAMTGEYGEAPETAVPAAAGMEYGPTAGEELQPMAAPYAGGSTSGVFPKAAQVGNIPWSGRAPAPAARNDAPRSLRPPERQQARVEALRPLPPVESAAPTMRPPDNERSRALQPLPSVAPIRKALRPPGG